MSRTDCAAVLDALEDQVYVFRSDGSVVYKNQAAHQTLPSGRELENISDLRKEFMLYHLDGESIPAEQLLSTKIMRGQISEALDVKSVHRASGETYYRRLQVSRMGKGSDLAILHVKDITERVTNVQALERARNRFEALFRSGPMATSITSRETGHFLDVNDMFLSMFGYPRMDVIGRKASDLGLRIGQDTRQTILRQLRMHGRSVNNEVTIHPPSGETLHLLTSWTQVEYHGENAHLTALVDITEHKALEEELGRALREMVEDASGFAKSLIARLAKAPAVKTASDIPEKKLGAELTNREREVLKWAARGYSDTQIAEKLGIASVTARNHLSRIYKKLDLHSRVDTVIWAREHNLHQRAHVNE